MKITFSPVVVEVHLLSCWNTACDIPVTAVFLRSRMAHCYWFLEALRVFEACIVMEYDI